VIQDIKKAVRKHWEEQFVQPLEPLKLLLKVFREGGYAVETTFDFVDERGRKTTHSFKTLIQPDMDIVDFIPNIPKYFRNAAWMTLCDEHRTIHLQKIKEFERTIFGQEVLLDKLVDGSLIIINITPFIKVITDFSPETALFSTGTAVASVIFRKYGKSKMISLTTKNAMRIFKAVNKIRSFFKKKKTK